VRAARIAGMSYPQLIARLAEVAHRRLRAGSGARPRG